jgi:hypothetical protein
VKLLFGKEIFVSDYTRDHIVKTKLDGSEWQTLGKSGSGKHQFNGPWGISYDKDTCNIYVGDFYNSRIVKTKINGSGWTSYGSSGYGVGLFNRPTYTYYENSTGFVYVSDYETSHIVKTMMNGSGWQTYGSVGSGKGQFDSPLGIHFENDTGYVYICDTNNYRIVRTMMNGSGWKTYGSLGTGKGQFNFITDLFFDNTTGFIYVADRSNHRIVKTKINGSGWTTYGSRGSGIGQFNMPYGISYDKDTDYIYVTDAGNSRIVRTKINGSGWKTYGTFGYGTGQFVYPVDVAHGISNYCSDGYLSSIYYKCNGSANFTRLNWTGVNPPGTSIKFQLRTATSSSGLNVKPFVGPNGSNKKFYINSDEEIWSGHDGDRWVQYKVYLSTSNQSITPVLKDVTIFFNLFPEQPILLTPENNSWINENIPVFNWNFTDKDSSTQEKFQWQMDDNPKFWDIDYDSGIVLSTISSITLTQAIPDGTWYWRIRTKDSDGDWGPYCSSWRFDLDTKAPNSTIISPVNNRFYNNLSIISGNATDHTIGIGVEIVEISIKRLSDDAYWNGTDWVSTKNWLLTSGTTEWSFDSSGVNWMSNTEYQIRSRAIDALTNTEYPSDDKIFSFDSIAPNSIIEHPMNNSYLNDLPEISGSSIDTGGSGLNKVEICFKKANNDVYWTGVEWSSTETWLTVDGTNHWSYDSRKIPLVSGKQFIISSRATDNITNMETEIDECIFTFDNYLPISTIDFPINNTYLNDINSIFGKSLDPFGSGIDKVEISILQLNEKLYWDGNNWGTNEYWLQASGIMNWSLNATNIPWQTDNYYTVSSRATDLAENIEIVGSNVTFMFDNKPPELLMMINNDDIFTNTNLVTLSISSEDPGSGVSVMSLSIDNVEWSDWKTYDDEISFQLPKGDSGKTVYIKVQDKIGNIAGPASDFIILDTSPPENLSIKINNNARYTGSSNVLLSLFATDNLSGLQNMSFSLDQETWTPWEPFENEKVLTLPLDDGDKIVNFRVNDNAGNIAIDGSSIILDTTAPHSLSIIINNGSLKTKNTLVRLQVRAEDAISGVSQMSFSYDNQTWTDWINYSENTTGELPYVKGEHTIHFRVNDWVGNVAYPVSATITLKIKSPPPEEPSKKSMDKNDYSMYIIWALIILIIITLIIIFTYIRQRKKRKEREAELVSRALGSSQGVVNTMDLGAKPQQSQFTSAQAPGQLAQVKQFPQLPPAQQTLTIPPVAITVEPVPKPQPTSELMVQPASSVPAGPTKEASPPQPVQNLGVVLPPESKSSVPATTPGITPEQQKVREDTDDGESEG